MESSLATVIKIAKVSQELTVALTDANVSGVNRPEISRALLWLNKIVVSSGGILEILNQRMIDSSPLDEQLEDWISTNGPVICLLALNEMKRIIKTDHARKTHFSILPSIFSPMPPQEKIHEAIKVFDNHQNYFDYLLTSAVR